MLLLAAAVAIAISLVSAPGWPGAVGAGLAVSMLAIAVIDYRSFRIPDELNAIGLVLALAHAIAQAPDAWVSAITDAGLRGAVLALIFWGLRSGYAMIRGRDGIGLGDVKLAAVAGAWLDWLSIPIAIQIAVFAALTVYLLRHLLSGRSLTMTHRLPFGTFLAPAIWITWVLERLMLQVF